MKVVEKFFDLIKKIFCRKEEVKMLKERITNLKENKFQELLKVNIEDKDNKVETLICEGDGLGIKKRMSS